METRYFLELNGTTVVGHVIATRSDWDTTAIPSTWLQVTNDVYASTLRGSVQQADGSFLPPTPSMPARRLSKFAFLRLLDPTEYAGMFTQTEPTLAYGVACFHVAPDPFDMDDPLVAQMLDYCVATGALTHARRDALWAAMQAAV